MTPETTTNEKRPVWVWVAGLYFILVGIAAIVMTTLLLTGAVPLDEDPATRDYFLAIVYRLSSVLYIAGGVTLLTYRKISYYLFLGAIAAIFAANVNYWLVEGSSPVSMDSVIFYAPEWIALVATTLYASRLKATGYLK